MGRSGQERDGVQVVSGPALCRRRRCVIDIQIGGDLANDAKSFPLDSPLTGQCSVDEQRDCASGQCICEFLTPLFHDVVFDEWGFGLWSMPLLQVWLLS